MKKQQPKIKDELSDLNPQEVKIAVENAFKAVNQALGELSSRMAEFNRKRKAVRETIHSGIRKTSGRII